VNDPKRPKTNPAMATAAMSVIAIRITVARTGEIAFLRLDVVILKMVPFYDQTPENVTDAPLLRLNWPTACEPIVCARVATSCVQVTDSEPDAGTVPDGAALQATADPPIWTLPPVTATLDVPVFVNVTVHWLLPAVVDPAIPALQDVTWAETCAELVNDPNRPKTNPAMATAAMSVIAMRMTVASTGEMAFLFFLRTFSMFIVKLDACCFVYKSRMEYLSSFW
jgi:hypothetical protein